MESCSHKGLCSRSGCSREWSWNEDTTGRIPGKEQDKKKEYSFTPSFPCPSSPSSSPSCPFSPSSPSSPLMRRPIRRTASAYPRTTKTTIRHTSVIATTTFSAFLAALAAFFNAFFSSLDNLIFLAGRSSSSSESLSPSTSIASLDRRFFPLSFSFSLFLCLLFFGGGDASMSGNAGSASSISTSPPRCRVASTSSSSLSSSSSARLSNTRRIASAFLVGGAPVSKNASRSSTCARRASPNLEVGLSRKALVGVPNKKRERRTGVTVYPRCDRALVGQEP